ncbi:MAG TPA: hypothetical protein VFX44_02775 [Solirubrobacterales bacterium]|nr:hypothetical protein [Solirubrobacterales bacterium]
MRERKTQGRFRLLFPGFLCLLLSLLAVSEAAAADRPPYEFDATLSLTGNCSTSKVDPVPDPGCPEKKPPQAFTKLTAIAIDSFGDEYVASYGVEEGKQGRIDVFSPEGVYLTEVKDEFGPKNIAVDSKGTLYTFDQSPGHPGEFARYKPLVYKPAEEKIEYGPRELIATDPGSSEGGIAIDENDHVLVDWSISIKEYGSLGEENKLLDTITNERLYSSTFIALDQQRRRLYASSCPDHNVDECWVIVLNADKPHELLEEIKGPDPGKSFASAKGWISVAVDEETGDFFIGDLEQTKNVYQFNEEYERVSTLAQSPELFEGGSTLQIAVSNAKGAFNHKYLFVPSLKSPPRALAYHPPEPVPPKIEAIFVTGISQTEAELQAQVNPGGADTTYRLEYLSQQEYEEAGNSFTGAKVAGEGTIQPDEQEAEVKAPIAGLQPGVTYRFRAFAKNEKGEDEKEVTFAPYSDAPGTRNCENQSLRTGYSALLPDCRAYELVTPADTNGQSPVGTTGAGDSDIFPGVKTSPGGTAVSFLTHGGSLPGFEGTGSHNGDTYRTTRTASGWSTESAGPTGAEATAANPGSTSPDQGFSFWETTTEGSAVVNGENTHYVRYPDGHSALVGRGSLGTDPAARGKLITAGGTHIVFETRGHGKAQPIQLEPDAPPSGTRAVYDRTPDEVTHVISLLPGDETPEGDAAYVGASPDGNGIAFQIGNKLYLRVGDATTYEIGEGLEFAGVAEGGSRIFYVEGGNLIAFDTESEEAIPFTETGNAIPVNVASGGTRAYFVSTTAIGGSGENPNGASAKAGQQNLYLSEEGAIRFVATVTKADVEGKEEQNFGRIEGLGLWVLGMKGQPSRDSSRANPSGTVLLFQSGADLDSYDPEGASQVYRYDSASERLHCISCIPTKTPAGGSANLQSVETLLDVAAPLNLSVLVPNLRADGKRAFFQSTEALVSRDNDESQDVYEWEEKEVGSCIRPGGCVYLISSGHTKGTNYLYGVSQSGDDVFFTTPDTLVNGDNDTPSIYDARVNGGFPEGVCPEGGCCEGDCRPDSSAPPPLPSPVTMAVGPSGNLPHCPKGKHIATRNGKQVCVKNKKKHHRKHHKAKKGAGK